jgi:hypothetical protein
LQHPRVTANLGTTRRGALGRIALRGLMRKRRLLAEGCGHCSAVRSSADAHVAPHEHLIEPREPMNYAWSLRSYCATNFSAFTAMRRHLAYGAIAFFVIGLALSFAVGSAEHEPTAGSETPSLHHGAPAMAASVPAGPFVIDSAKSSGELLDQSMAVMSRDMKQAPMSGNPDHDFARMMIPHHQGAIDMAKVELVHGKNPVLRRLAQEIIVTQRSEIDVLRMQLDAMRSESRTPGRSAR